VAKSLFTEAKGGATEAATFGQNK